MTHEEAIKLLSQMFLIQFTAEEHNALGMAIDALNCSKILNGSDLISRQDAVSEIHRYFCQEIEKTPRAINEDGDEVYTDMPTVNSLLACNKELSKRIKSLPSADRPTGKWTIEEAESIYGKKYILTCPECGESVSVTEQALPHEKFCRNCGSYNGE